MICTDVCSSENIYLVGSWQNWSTDNALILNPANYPTWSSAYTLLTRFGVTPDLTSVQTVTVNLPANANVQYKFIRKFNGQVTWESDPNRSLTVPASGTFTENDTWK